METFINRYITLNRLKPYLVKSNNNPKRALTLYEININYSSELYKLLSILEISLRNLVNKRCIDLFGYDWLTNIKWDIHSYILNSFYRTGKSTEKTLIVLDKIFSVQENIIKDAMDRLKEENKPITNDNLVSNVVFGFWTNIFNKAYDGILWNKSLSTIFNKQFERKEIEHMLNKLRQLRNRIAHNECVMSMKYSPQKHYKRIITILNAIDPKLEKWAKKQVNRELLE